MSWVLLVVIGGIVNALVNFGYKRYGLKMDVVPMMASVVTVSAIVITAYALVMEPENFAMLLKGNTPFIVLAMGVGMAAVWVIMAVALVRGPISLVDPLWACIYAITSVVIGIVLAKENPGIIPLCGIGLYLIGAFLMARGARSKPAAES